MIAVVVGFGVAVGGAIAWCGWWFCCWLLFVLVFGLRAWRLCWLLYFGICALVVCSLLFVLVCYAGFVCGDVR